VHPVERNGALEQRSCASLLYLLTNSSGKISCCTYVNLLVLVLKLQCPIVINLSVSGKGSYPVLPSWLQDSRYLLNVFWCMDAVVDTATELVHCELEVNLS